jgi:predicted short-subunit dehydrogenase-like oxidoreductase (DUF2520 family)
MGIKIAVIGAGNLATRISISLKEKSIEFVQVFSRTEKSAFALAEKLECSYTVDPLVITKDADMYLISVSDSALSELLPKINFNSKLVVHTAGSVPMEVMKDSSANYGVFYPLQTFSKQRIIDFKSIPFCIEANSIENEKILVDLASELSDDVRMISSEQRKQIHLAAVFASNFVNHMFAVASKILAEKDVPFDILYPLIDETVSKAKEIDPVLAQTGPAIRNDQNTMDEHLKMLADDPDLKDLYDSLSKSILKFSNLQRGFNC